MGAQAFWREAEQARAPLEVKVCPCCHRPLPRSQEVDGIAFGVAARHFDVTEAGLRGPGRTERITRARALVVWALRSLGNQLSYPAIGRLLGERHHSTIINLHQKAISLRLRDPVFAAQCREVVDLLTAQEASDDHF
ncbi:MAG: hypothetical protein KGL44_03775 [Sphingomonadales bacterium]|nr:hypothetical protein [Sphingomonadales bacterium]